MHCIVPQTQFNTIMTLKDKSLVLENLITKEIHNKMIMVMKPNNMTFAIILTNFLVNPNFFLESKSKPHTRSNTDKGKNNLKYSSFDWRFPSLDKTLLICAMLSYCANTFVYIFILQQL